MDEIEEKIRRISLAERLERSLKIVKSIASDGRDLRMSVPVQPTDEDVFLVTTLSDATRELERQKLEIKYLRQLICGEMTIANADIDLMFEDWLKDNKDV